MIFETVVMCENEILFDEKIVADNRDQALIKLGRRLEQDGILTEEITEIHVRQFSVSVSTPISPFTVTGTTANIVTSGTVTTSPTWSTTGTNTLTIR